MLKALIFFIVFLTTYFGVGAFRRWSLKKKLLDIPNERSSHTQPTPRGGGLIIVLVTLFTFGLYLLIKDENVPLYFLLGGIGIALISWFDDLFTIAFGWRFLIHTAMALLAIWGLGFWNEIYIPWFGKLYLGNFGIFLTFCWIVWLTNAFNFMDGIDGIAGTQALTAGLGWFLLSLILGFENTGMLGGILAFSSLGFMIHNWPPAKIFMGDVCSAFLGYTFAGLPLLAQREVSFGQNRLLLPYIGVLLVWFFVFDSLLTFFKRLFRGEKIWQAHREHIYQKMIIGGFSHQAVTLLYGAFSAILVVFLITWLSLGGAFGIFLVLITSFMSLGILFIRKKKN